MFLLLEDQLRDRRCMAHCPNLALLAFTNNVFLAHSSFVDVFSLAASELPLQSQVVATETVWSANLEADLTQPPTKRHCHSALDHYDGHFPHGRALCIFLL